MLVALWEFVPENSRSQLSPYQAACVPAVEVRKLVRALSCLGTIPRNMASDFRKVCFEWKVTVRQNKRERPHKELQMDLRNACIELLARGQDSVVSHLEAGPALVSHLKEKFRVQMFVTVERQRVRLLVPWVTFW